MTMPENGPAEPSAHAMPDSTPEGLDDLVTPTPEDDTPAWADGDAFAEATEEPGFDAWVQELDREAAETEPGPAEVAEVEAAEVEAAEVEAAEVEAAEVELPPETEPSLEPLPEPVTEPQVVSAWPEPEPELEPQVVSAWPEPEPEPETELEPAVELPAGEEQPLTAGVEAPSAAVAAVRAGGSGWTRLLAAVVAVLVLLGAALGLLAVRSAGAGPLQDDRDHALDAARSAARAVFSYDYRHLAKDFAAGRAVTTGAFRAEYERTTGKLVGDVAPQYKAVVVAEVSSAGVVDAHPGRVLVLAFVNQESTSTLTAAPKITQSRLELTMVERDGHWLIEQIRAF